MMKWVYSFGPRGVDGSMHMRNTLGGKGASLADMTRLGLPVPPGFTLTTSCCSAFVKNNNQLTDEMIEQINEAILRLEGETGKTFLNPRNPLVLAIRPGAKALMPGIMDTVLCLGLTSDLIDEWGKYNDHNNQSLWNAYRRFIRTFSEVVLNVEGAYFDELIVALRKEYNVSALRRLSAQDLRDVTIRFRKLAQEHISEEFPTDPKEQLYRSIEAGFKSWNSRRATLFRQMHNIVDKDDGAAVTVQTQILGVRHAEQSGSGYCWSRDPHTGENKCTGAFVTGGIGEDYNDLSARLQALSKSESETPETSLEAQMPWVWHDLLHAREVVEKWYGTMRQLEFAVEDGRLWLLQSHTAEPKTPEAALKIAVEMVKEGMIRRQDAVQNLRPEQLEKMLHPSLDATGNINIMSRGMGASPGAVSAIACFSTKSVLKHVEKGEKVILIAEETRSDDVIAIQAASGILTTRGGISSHAAVIARGMGKPCIAGASELRFNKSKTAISASNLKVKEGEYITIDGLTGLVIQGEVAIKLPNLNDDFSEFMSWVDKYREIEVRANGESLDEIATAREFGAEGIGLIRTEHMFLKDDRLSLVREMILAKNSHERQQVLSKILPMQREDFIALFKASDGWPVTIRLLDPPLHEFLPDEQEDISELAKAMKRETHEVQRHIERLNEANPMLGHRGVRLGITTAEIYKMQAQAIFEAAAQTIQEGTDVQLEIMIPLVSLNDEVAFIKPMLQEIAYYVEKEQKVSINWSIGSMIETPRAALRAADIAQAADFFSFGTNDLTQMTWGVSRDDSGDFLRSYLSQGILTVDPFKTMDLVGVGELIKIAVERGRKANPKLICGICGEHGGDPRTINFCYEAGVDYISCSPWRVPVARLAAAQAALKQQAKED
ncbi:MAG: pyruvate, phosphate dikinase [Alphaproteobacteria bacterium]